MINVRSVTSVFLYQDKVLRGLVAKKLDSVCSHIHIEGTTRGYDNFVVIQPVLVETRLPPHSRTLGRRNLQPNRSEVTLAMTTAKVVQGEKFL